MVFVILVMLAVAVLLDEEFHIFFSFSFSFFEFIELLSIDGVDSFGVGDFLGVDAVVIVSLSSFCINIT